MFTNFVWSQGNTESLAVTYIANEGFLIEASNNKILIDALFGGINGNWCDQPDDSITNLLLNGIAPFNSIDVLLVTHKHIDHFNEQMVIKFLKKNQHSILICPNQVNDVLKQNYDYPEVSKRIKSLKADSILDTLMSINSIHIGVMRFDHGMYLITDSVSGKTINIHSDIVNFCYVIEVNGFSILHSGDCSTTNYNQYLSYGFSKKKIDIALFDRIFLRPEGMKIINDFFPKSNFILMHIEQGKIEYFKSITRNIAEIFIFSKPLEKKVYTKKI